MAKTSSSRCEMNSTAAPWLFRVRITSKRRSTSVADSAAVGSSMTITLALTDRALPISPTCWSAMDRPRANRRGIEGTAEPLEDRGRLVLHGPAVDPAAATERLAADEHVLRDGQV